MSPAIWSLRVCTDPMANVLTICLSFLERGGEYWDTAFLTREAGAVADEAERKKSARYSHLERSHYFVPIAVKTFGVFGPEAHSFCGALVIVLFRLLKILFLIFILNSNSLWLCRGVIWFQSGDLLLSYLWRTPTCTSHWFFPLFFVFPFNSFHRCFVMLFPFTGRVYHSPLLLMIISSPTLFCFHIL